MCVCVCVICGGVRGVCDVLIERIELEYVCYQSTQIPHAHDLTIRSVLCHKYTHTLGYTHFRVHMYTLPLP